MPIKAAPRRVRRKRQRGIMVILRRNLPTMFVLGTISLMVWILIILTSIASSNFGSSAATGDAPRLRGGGSGVDVNATRSDLAWVHADSQVFNENSVASRATHLIVVAGHSVLVSGDVRRAPSADAVWYLYDYQRGRGLPQAIAAHIRAGIRLALEDEAGLLVFSGGMTRGVTGPESEGASYFRVADALGLWDGREAAPDAGDGADAPGATGTANRQSTVRARAVTEDYATDSFQNLLYSICRFREVTGAYPARISLVSFSFKQARFETLHAHALRWPLDSFRYIGVDPPSSTGFDLGASTEGERKNSLQPFREDPYGCHTEVLQRKRRERNPFARRAPYELTCPEMKELLRWCGPELIPVEAVPWGGL